MPVCLKPLCIPRPGIPDRPSQAVSGMPVLMRDTMVVPCGKCINCTKNRQNDIAFRIRSEADKRGTLCFLTLTYNDDNLPLVSTLWRCNKESGECERLTDPEFVCYSRREDFWGYRKDFSAIVPSNKPRYYDIDTFDDGYYRYFTRITPSVCRKDVQNWLKRCRVYFERKLGRTLDFSYSICSEYGEKYCRPHYHCCLMGITQDDAQICANLWKFGFTKLDWIPRINKDGSDGFSAVASYVAKYIAKGDCKCDCEKEHTALSCRQMNSKRLGFVIADSYRNYMMCTDMIGAWYDIDNFWCPDKKRYLSRPEIAQLIAEVPKRLSVSLSGKVAFAIPRIIRKKVFYVEKLSLDGKTKYCRPSKLWRMVVDSLQSQYAELDRQQLKGLLSDKSPREAAEAVSSFYMQSESFAEISNAVGIADYKMKHLSKSVF